MRRKYFLLLSLLLRIINAAQPRDQETVDGAGKGLARDLDTTKDLTLCMPRVLQPTGHPVSNCRQVYST